MRKALNVMAYMADYEEMVADYIKQRQAKLATATPTEAPPRHLTGPDPLNNSTTVTSK